MGDEGLTTLGSYNARGGGMCQLAAPAIAGKYAIKIETSSGHNFSGPTIKNLALIGNATCAGGLYIGRYSNMRLDNIRTSDFSTGAGLWIRGDGTASQYGSIYMQRDSGSKYGIRISEGSGHSFFRAMLSGDRNNSDSLISGSKGIWLDAEDLNGSCSFHGGNVQGYETLIDIEDDDGSSFHGVRGEGWDPTTGFGIRLRNTLGGGGRCKYTSFFGGLMNNNLSGNTGTALKLETGVSKINFQMSHVEAVTTQIDNSSGNDDHVLLIDGADPYARHVRADTFGCDVTGDSTRGAVVDSVAWHDKAGNLIGYINIRAES
jgi:hypothetical protein